MELLTFWAPIAGSLVATFSEAFVKTFQSRNIAQGHEKTATVTSVLVTTTFFANVSFIVIVGLPALVTSGIGGALGVYFSMKLHKRVFKHK